jgi:hypothetical protein
VIAEHFFEAKAKSKVKVFSAKKSADLSLCVRNEKYQEVLQHLVDLDEGNEEVRTQHRSHFVHLVTALTILQVLFAPKHGGSSFRTSEILSARNKGKKRKLSDSATHKVGFWYGTCLR